MKYLLFATIIFLYPLQLLGQNLEYLADSVGNNQIIHRTWYSLSYNEKFEQADWVAYSLTANEVEGQTPRKNNFKTDPEISTFSANSNDYKGSGYDRGHLVPAADMKMSIESMASSFLYSNISPQHPSFNRGIWRTLETKVRQWAKIEGEIYVITGPVLAKGIYKFIGANRVGVPKYYYKVIYDPTGKRKAIGFILENSNNNKLSLHHYAVTVDSVESFTGLDFYYNISDQFEEPIESVLEVGKWFSTANDQCEYYNSKKIFTGPKGGKYYINLNGKKTYVSGKKRSRIARKPCN